MELEPEGLAIDELWRLTGFVRCADCGYLVHTQTLGALPEHHCTQRQARPRVKQRVTHSAPSVLPKVKRGQVDVIRDLSYYDSPRPESHNPGSTEEDG